MDLITDLSDRLMTRNDLRQFLEAVLAAVGDRFQSKSVFIAAFENNALTMVVSQGDTGFLEENHLRKIYYRQWPIMDQERMYSDGEIICSYPCLNRESGRAGTAGILGLDQDPNIEFRCR